MERQHVCLGLSLSFPSWRAHAVCVVSVCAVTAFYYPAPVSVIPFLYFQTVAEVVKELEKNEKIRLQLECNKPGENVSDCSWFSLRGGQQMQGGHWEWLPTALLGEFPACMLEFSIL